MNTWSDIRMPAHQEHTWELYHENSKTPRWRDLRLQISDHEDFFNVMHTSLPSQPIWKWKIAAESDDGQSAHDLNERFDVQWLNKVSRLLGQALMATPGEPTHEALLPLEMYMVLPEMDDVPWAIAHIDRGQMEIAAIHDLVDGKRLQACFGNDHQIRTMLCITAMLQRSALVFGEKGYRFAVSESGRLTQKILHAAQVTNVVAALETHYYERNIESILGIDGVEHVLLQVVSLS